MADDPNRGFDRPLLDYKTMWANIAANHERLNGCRIHRFETDLAPEQIRRRIGLRLTCKHCGGEMNAIDVRNYVLGFIAAGGDPNVVFPGWN